MAEDPNSDGGVNPQAVTPWVAKSDKSFRRAAYLDNGAAVVSSASVQPDSLLNKVLDVTTSRIQLAAANANRSALVVTNQGSVTLYVGNSSVITGATANAAGGFAVLAGGTLSLSGLDAALALYGITNSGTTQVGVLETVDA